MSNTYQIYLISDSTGETLDRIFTAIKVQFKNIDYKIYTYSFTRTENQILKILSNAQENQNPIILYSIVDSSLAKHLARNSEEKKNTLFWCSWRFNFKLFKIAQPESVSSTEWSIYAK